MPITIGAHVQQAGAGTSGSIDTSGASLLIAGQSGTSTTAPTDSKSNTWVQVGATQTFQSGTGQCTVWKVENPTVGAGHTFTPGGSRTGLAVLAVNGGTMSSPQDQLTQASSQASPAQAGSLTPAASNEIVLMLAGYFSNIGESIPATINGGFAMVEEVFGAVGGCYSVALAYLIQTAAAAANPALTYNDTFSLQAGVMLVSFKEAGGGGDAGLSFNRRQRETSQSNLRRRARPGAWKRDKDSYLYTPRYFDLKRAA